MWSRIPDTAAPELCWAGAGSRDLSRQETQTVSCGSANCQTGICRPISGSQARARAPGAFLRASEPRLCGESCSLLFALVSTTSAFLCQSSKSRIGWLCLADSAHRRSGGQHTQLHLGWTRILRQLGSDERIIHAFLALFFCSCIHSSLPKKNLKKNLGFFLHSARC